MPCDDRHSQAECGCVWFADIAAVAGKAGPYVRWQIWWPVRLAGSEAVPRVKDEIRHVRMAAHGVHEEVFAGYPVAGCRWRLRVPEGLDLIHINEMEAEPVAQAGSGMRLRITGRGQSGYAIVQADFGRPWQGTPACMVMLMIELTE
jgi:hypothetical protein